MSKKPTKTPRAKCYRAKCPTPKACKGGCLSYERDHATATKAGKAIPSFTGGK